MAFDVAMFLACFHVWSIKGCCLLSSSKAKMSSVSDLRRSLEHCFLSYSQNKINQWIIIFFVSSLITRNIMKIEKSKNYQKISNTINLYGWYENKSQLLVYSDWIWENASLRLVSPSPRILHQLCLNLPSPNVSTKYFSILQPLMIFHSFY